jgi:hypothetical protein
LARDTTLSTAHGSLRYQLSSGEEKMTEETKQDQVIETREENEPNIREHKAFKAVAKQKAELEAPKTVICSAIF